MKTRHYKGYCIRSTTSQVGSNHPQTGKYLSAEFFIGFEQNGAYTEQQYIPDALFFDTEIEAETATLLRAQRIIDEKYL